MAHFLKSHEAYAKQQKILQREICLEQNEDNFWEMVPDSRKQQSELLGDAIISLLSVFMKSGSHFSIPTELKEALCSMSGEKISQRILQNRDALINAGITFDIRRSNGKQLIELIRADGDDSADKTGAYYPKHRPY